MNARSLLRVDLLADVVSHCLGDRGMFRLCTRQRTTRMRVCTHHDFPGVLRRAVTHLPDRVAVADPLAC